MHLKFGDLADVVSTLSGGNQQKVVLAAMAAVLMLGTTIDDAQDDGRPGRATTHLRGPPDRGVLRCAGRNEVLSEGERSHLKQTMAIFSLLTIVSAW